MNNEKSGMLRRRPQHLALTVILMLTAVLPELGCRMGKEHEPAATGAVPNYQTVGLAQNGQIIVPTNQILEPAGKEILFAGRPVDLLLIDDDKTLVVKNSYNNNVIFINTDTAEIKQTSSSAIEQEPFGDVGPSIGLGVVGLASIGDKIFVSDVLNSVAVLEKRQDGSYGWTKSLRLAKPIVTGVWRGEKSREPGTEEIAYPAGIAIQDSNHIWVTSSRGNTAQLINVVTGTVDEVVDVGVAPYMPIVVGERVYVSNWGGDPPGKGEPQQTSSGTPVRIDPRTGVANDGSVSVLEKGPGGWKLIKSIKVGLHPSGMCRSKNGSFLYVANANSDTVSVIDTSNNAVIETILCRPVDSLPFGSGTNALALSPDGKMLYAANGTNNCIAVIELGASFCESQMPDTVPAASTVLGLIPTSWYPGAVKVSADGRRLFVANVKGHGSLSQPRPVKEGHHVKDYVGTVAIVDVPDSNQLSEYTRRVNTNNRLALSIAGLTKPRPHIRPVPVPERSGEPSVFEHVIYVIKENKTYDQVFGDMKDKHGRPLGNGDPNLCIFGEEITPNHHKLAREFTLLDNFYCSGVISMDGHQWVNQAYVTDYLEKAFGGPLRSYPYDGADPLAMAATGSLWDNALAHQRTFRNYGEFTQTSYDPPGATWADIYADYFNGTQNVKIHVEPMIKAMTPYTHLSYPGFPLKTPDIYRAKIFIDELGEFEKKGSLPNLIYLFLPQDHTDGLVPGVPTPRAMLANNDLALGQVVEAVSRSRFWAKTVIFVVEDDPQDGFDHVDGHRTVALAISPYTRRGYVDSTCYNQTGMVKTIELILGLEPMNQLDLSAAPMRACFMSKPDLRPYSHAANRVPLTEINKELSQLEGEALRYARLSLELDFDKEDRANEDAFNRILWYAMRPGEPYPAGQTADMEDSN